MSHKQFPLLLLSLVCLLAIVASDLRGQTSRFPEPSSNAALHYNRAMLSLGAIPLETREVLMRPIWESFGDSTKEQIADLSGSLVYQGRHAIHAALEGSRRANCEFGIDYSDFGQGANVPHAPLMLQLGRLVTIAGIHAQISGQQDQAAEYFLNVMNMGHHLASQPSLLESLVAIEMLETSYYALAFWATRCDSTPLVNEVLNRLTIDAKRDLSPARVLASEADIFDRQVGRIVSEFPDGNWAELLLEAWGEFAAAGSRAELEEKAKAIAIKRGTTNATFQNASAFAVVADRVRKLHTSYLREAAACVALECSARARRAEELYAKYLPQFEAIGDTEFVDVREIGRYFATHEAELMMARIALVAAASREDGKFPANLEQIKARFGGAVPTSPYDGGKVQYSTSDDGQSFSITIPEVAINGISFPRVEFSSVRPPRASQ